TASPVGRSRLGDRSAELGHAENVMRRRLPGGEGGQPVFGRGHRQPPDVEQRTYEPKALDMGSVVARLVGARALAGVQKTLTQVVLDGRNGDTRLPADDGHAQVNLALPVTLPLQTVYRHRVHYSDNQYLHLV